MVYLGFISRTSTGRDDQTSVYLSLRCSLVVYLGNSSTWNGRGSGAGSVREKEIRDFGLRPA